MAEKVRSAVVILHDKDSFIVERRPYLPGKLAYPGMLQLLGGGVEVGEEPSAAAAREIKEEVTLSVVPAALEEVWAGDYEGLDKYGQPIVREVAVYGLGLTALGAGRLELQEQGELVRIDKTPEAIEASESELTPFACSILEAYVSGTDPQFEKRRENVSTD